MTTGLWSLWILLTCFHVFVDSQGDWGLTEWTTAPNMAAPVLNLHRKEMTLERGSDLVITCMGTSNLSWTYPDVQTVEPLASSRLTILTNHTSRDTYLSVLRLTGVQYADTGYYTCRYGNSNYDQSEDVLAGDVSASVYIYVPDDDHLYAPPFRDHTDGHPILGIMYSGAPYVLPCRPTHPRSDVTLRKGGRELEMGRDITYDRKAGFTILVPNVYYSGMFTCIFSFNGTTQQLPALLTYKAGAHVPQPEVDASHSNILVGETLKLKCYVKVQLSTLAHIEWTWPSQERSSRIRLSKTERQTLTANSYHYAEMERSLTVRNVSKMDGGVYRCRVTTHDSKSNHHDTLINVHETTFVHLTPMNVVQEVPLGAHAVYLSMSIHAYPRPNITWYRHGQPIRATDRQKEIRERSDRTKLKLYNVDAEDAGDYVVRAVTRDMNDTETITLIVTEPATVSRLFSPNNTNYHLANKYYNIVCEFHGVPKPTVTWSWQPCLIMGCTPHPARWRPVTTSTNLPQISKSSNRTRLTLIARETGFYNCTTSNKMGADSQVISFDVSDVAGGFELSSSKSSPVEGDRLRLQCKCHKLIYSLPRMYLQRGEQLILLTNTSTLTLTQTSTEYSHVLTTVIENMNMSDSGKYSCLAENKYGERHQTSLQVHVTEMSAPVFSKHLGGVFYMEPGTKYTMECRALGLPYPTVHWYKDGEALNDTGLVYKLNANHTRLSFGSIKESAGGTYSCEAVNRAGSVTSNTTLYINIPVITSPVRQEGLTKLHIGMIVGFFLFIIALIILITIITRRHCQPRYYSDEYLLASKTFNPDLPIDIQPECIAYDPKWEFPRDQLTFGMLLGQGAFGKVVRAEAFGIGVNGMEGTTTIVAVKMPKDFSDTDQMKALLSELKVLIHIGQHLNIVNLLGACTKDMRKGVLYVIVEYCRYGNLLNYLLKKRDNFIDTMSDKKSVTSQTNGSLTKGDLFLEYGREYVNTSAQPVREEEEPPDLGPLTTKDLLCYAFQIARGMDYLASRKYIHRDLAARNVLLADGGIVKIADFGLAKDCYKYDEYQKKTNGPVPVKWLALESLTHKVYTSKSDVWAYGVLLWELFTVGGNPYPGLTIDESFVERLKNGYRMDRPPYATEHIYGTMLQCWAHSPDGRPDFSELADRFGNLLQASVRQHYIDLETMIGQRTPERSTTGYLRMAGSTLTSYVPMSSDPGDSARTIPEHDSAITIPEPEPNCFIPQSDSGYDYSELLHLRHSQSYSSPTVDTVNECDEHNTENDDTIIDNNNDSNKDITMETTAMVHTLPPGGEGEEGEEMGGSGEEMGGSGEDMGGSGEEMGGSGEEMGGSGEEMGGSDGGSDHDHVDPGDGSDSSPFLNRTDSDKSDVSGPRCGRRHMKCHDSVSSDASSGFHSCYYPDDSPTDYPNGLIMNGIPPKEVMV